MGWQACTIRNIFKLRRQRVERAVSPAARGAGLWVIVALGTIPACSAWIARAAGHDAGAARVVYRNAAPGVAYLGSKACAACHAGIYRQYTGTAMGRSMRLASDPVELERASLPNAVFSSKLQRHFKVLLQDGEIYQSEFEAGPAAEKVFETRQKIVYALGSGSNGVSYIVQRGAYLDQAPLTYYAKTGLYGLSPGFEDHDFGFSRPIRSACIACHSGRPQPVPGGEGLYRDPPFLELAIGCENCHGPGQLHVAERLSGAALEGGGDTAIVNPGKLPGWLADNICMSCHQTGDARVLQPGKDYLDFRPGAPLDETVALFAVPLSRDTLPDSPLLQHYSLMTLSRCYRESGGRIHCATCHDPHLPSSSPEAAAHYRSACLGCHAENACKLPADVRRAGPAVDNCASCHMPRQNLADIPHSALTNHRIVARPGEPFPAQTFGRATPPLADLVHLSVVPGEASRPVPPLTLLQVYAEVTGSRPGYEARYFDLVDQLASARLENPLVLEGLARKAVRGNTPQGEAHGEMEAMGYLERAVKLGTPSSDTYQWLAALQARHGQVSSAIQTLERGLKLSPADGLLYRSLGLLYSSTGKYTEAADAIRRELELSPQDDGARQLLGRVEAAIESRRRGGGLTPP